MHAAAFFERVDVGRVEGDVVALGDDLSPRTLLAAYRAGCFPWPTPELPVIPWCSPDPRAVLPVDRVHLGRTLRASVRRGGWTSTVDTAFADVVERCADRDETWITPAMRSAYVELHR